MNSKLNLQELEALMTGFWLTDFSNFSAYLYETMQDINWVGFYVSDGQKLRLGPFCGKPACTEILFSKGVCGKAFREAQTIIVDNVDHFPGHIICDSNSKSEIAIPIFISGQLSAILDVDAPILSRFTKEDQIQIESAVRILSIKISSYSGLIYGSIKQ